jgi:hypothetical protein
VCDLPVPRTPGWSWSYFRHSGGKYGKYLNKYTCITGRKSNINIHEFLLNLY